MNKTWKRGLVVIALVAVALVSFYIGSATLTTSAGASVNWSQAMQTVSLQQAPATATETEQLYSGIYNRVTPSVVSINVISRAGSTPETERFGEGTGTGFIIDTEGHIVTNNHVVDGAISIEVNFFDGRIVRGEIVGTDADSDLAVIKVNVAPETLTPVPLGDSSALFIGQNVVAIGSPFNQPWTMTTGIISALGRTIRGLTNYSIGAVIQTDAAINPGNSGGPLLNLAGEVVGVNSQISSETRSNSGIGFAIPSNLVTRVAADLIARGEVDYSYLGIQGGDVNLALMEALNLPNNARGVVVTGVEPGGPAAAAGLRNASNVREINGIAVPQSVDIILAVNGEPLSGMSELVSFLASSTAPGDLITLTVVRDGRDQIDLNVTLTGRP
ncbi:MAG: trypsin-like peptidase domain-containing protein [Chloroflexota bacterium]|nr:trypsin-like peptidase domain-containing protein [Chloroflexota bacterium]